MAPPHSDKAEFSEAVTKKATDWCCKLERTWNEVKQCQRGTDSSLREFYNFQSNLPSLNVDESPQIYTQCDDVLVLLAQTGEMRSGFITSGERPKGVVYLLGTSLWASVRFSDRRG